MLYIKESYTKMFNKHDLQIIQTTSVPGMHKIYCQKQQQQQNNYLIFKAVVPSWWVVTQKWAVGPQHRKKQCSMQIVK